MHHQEPRELLINEVFISFLGTNYKYRVSTGPGKPGKWSVHFPVRENDHFTKIQGRLREKFSEFHFLKIPGFLDYFTTKNGNN